MPLTFLLVICILFLLICIFLVIQKNKDEREFQDLMNYDADTEPDADKDESSRMTAGIYSAQSALRKAARHKEEGQIDEAIIEIKKIQEMQATRDNLYFKSFKKLIEDNIRENKFSSASKFLDKYQKMLGASTEKQYALVSYVPFQEFYKMKRDVAIGLSNVTEALKYSIISNWFSFREQYERPLNVLNFAYAEFITYLKQLNGGIISKKYLPKITTYLASGMPSTLKPIDFLDLETLENIIAKFQFEASTDNLKNFIKTSFYYPFEDFYHSLDLLFCNGKMKEWKSAIIMDSQITGNEVQESIKYALQEVKQRDIFVVGAKIEDGKILYENSKNVFVDCKDITIEFFNNEHLTGKNLPYNIFTVMYVLLYWEVIQAVRHPMDAGETVSTDIGLPEDVYHEGFHDRHAESFTRREAELFEVDLMEECVRCIADNKGKSFPFAPDVTWEMIDLDVINGIFSHFNNAKLLNFMHLLANEYRLNKTLPDLYLWSSESEDGKFIMVKHAEEPISENALFWLLNLHHNLHVPLEIVTIRTGVIANK